MSACPKPQPAPREPRRGIARTKAPRKRRLSVHAAKVRKANDLWRHLIYRKEPSGLCARCRVRPFVAAMHIFAKGPYPSMRFELDNGAPGCTTCHRRIDSDHKAKVLFAVGYIGQQRYDRLDLMSQGRGKCDLDLTILYLRSITGEP